MTYVCLYALLCCLRACVWANMCVWCALCVPVVSVCGVHYVYVVCIVHVEGIVCGWCMCGEGRCCMCMVFAFCMYDEHMCGVCVVCICSVYV